MNSPVAHRPSPWQLAAHASDRVADLITNIPGWEGYECSPATQEDLRQAAALLSQAAELLERGSDREEAINA